MGLLIYKLRELNVGKNSLNRVFRCFALAALPTYFLSVLWAHIPAWLYIVVLFGTAAQLYGWAILLMTLRKHAVLLREKLSALPQLLFLCIGIAVTIKLLLQTGSIIPAVSKLAFGFRPIVIGYLHLILLGIITLFILTYTYTFSFLAKPGAFRKGLIVFVTGILMNELILMTQGVSDILGIGIAYVNMLLLTAALVLFSGAMIMALGQLFFKDDLRHTIAATANRNFKKNKYGKYHSTVSGFAGAE
jgi:hypothetical protein